MDCIEVGPVILFFKIRFAVVEKGYGLLVKS